MAYRSAVYFSIGTNGTNRQVVYARPSVVNICSLQMVYQSTNYFSIGIDLYQYGMIGEGVLTIGICLCTLDMRD